MFLTDKMYSKGQFPLTFNLSRTNAFVKYKNEIPQNEKTLNTGPSYFIRLNRRKIYSVKLKEKFLNWLCVCTHPIAMVVNSFQTVHVQQPHVFPSHSNTPVHKWQQGQVCLLRWHASVHLFYSIYLWHWHVTFKSRLGNG